MPSEPSLSKIVHCNTGCIACCSVLMIASHNIPIYTACKMAICWLNLSTIIFRIIANRNCFFDVMSRAITVVEQVQASHLMADTNPHTPPGRSTTSHIVSLARSWPYVYRTSYNVVLMRSALFNSYNSTQRALGQNVRRDIRLFAFVLRYVFLACCVYIHT